MQRRSSISTFKFLCAAVAVGLTLPALTQAQDDNKALIDECVQAQKEKFEPLQTKSTNLYGVHSARSSVYYEIIRWLEANPEDAEANRQHEIEKAEARLEELKAAQNLTSGDAVSEDKVAKTIEEAHVKIEDIGDDRTVAMRPLDREKSALQREFSDQEDKLEPFMESLFPEQGSGELTSDLARSYASFSYSTAQASGQYKRDGKTLACSLRIYLVAPQRAQKDLGKVADKYTIVSKSTNQLDVLVGNGMVNIYTSDRKLNGDSLEKVLLELLDLEKLAELMK